MAAPILWPLLVMIPFMAFIKGSSKIANLFPYKQNSCNCFTPPPTSDYHHQGFLGLSIFVQGIKLSLLIFFYDHQKIKLKHKDLKNILVVIIKPSLYNTFYFSVEMSIIKLMKMTILAPF